MHGGRCVSGHIPRGLFKPPLRLGPILHTWGGWTWTAAVTWTHRLVVLGRLRFIGIEIPIPLLNRRRNMNHLMIPDAQERIAIRNLEK